jgi:hypothetical protein
MPCKPMSANSATGGGTRGDMLRRTPAPPEPWCLMSMIAYGSLRTIRVPESRIVFLQSHRWSVLARDSDCPMGDLPPGQAYHTPLSARHFTVSAPEEDED